MLFELTDPKGTIPTKGTPASAGYDLYAAEDAVIKGGEGMTLIPTYVAVRLEPGTYGSIRARSGLAYRHHMQVGGGVIDRDYFPNPIGVLLYCTRNGYEYTVKKGDRIAQLIIEKIVESVDTVIEYPTPSVHVGYGSTGC
jgi:deoxyuridine 5'-triphosphate nucleotidohydrolase